MLSLLLFLAALTAAEPPRDGHFLLLSETDETMGMVNAQSVVRDGDRVRILALGVFANPVREDEGDVWVVQVMEEVDCGRRQLRHLDYAGFSRELEAISFDHRPTQWQSYEPETPAAAIIEHLCDARPLASPGREFLPIAEAYWARRRLGPTTVA